MTIPRGKQKDFIKWFNEQAGPTFAKFGALKHELYKVTDKQLVGRQIVEENRFVERVYFADDFNLPDYFADARKDPQACQLSRMYEQEFQAENIELRILEKV